MKLTVTPELAILIKTLRMQNNITAKDFAEYIGKSPSYITKLERGDMKFLQRDNLTGILTFLAGGGDFYGEVLPGVYRVLLSFMSPDRLVFQGWLIHYDVAERRVSVPPAMAEEISRRLGELKVSSQTLTDLINANLDTEMTSAFPANEVVLEDYGDSRRVLVRASVSQEEVRRLLAGESPTAGYLLVYNVIYNLFRLIHFPDARKKLSPEDALIVLRNAGAYMEQYQIHALMGFSHLLFSDDFIRNQHPLAALSDGAGAGVAALSQLTAILREMTAQDALNTTHQLTTFLSTLNWDPAFAMALLGTPFAELNGLSYQNKRKLLEEIRALVDKYDSLPDFEKRMEAY